jgi:hypothetical protein
VFHAIGAAVAVLVAAWLKGLQMFACAQTGQCDIDTLDLKR